LADGDLATFQQRLDQARELVTQANELLAGGGDDSSSDESTTTTTTTTEPETSPA
jgi:hypothetical protein